MLCKFTHIPLRFLLVDMAGHLIAALLSISSITTASAKPVDTRLNDSPDIAEYIGQVKSALYVINSIKADNASTSCSDSDLPATLYAEGYDGDYAQQLL